MSMWFELITSVLQAQATPGRDTIETCANVGGICPATAFNAVTAAFATQGYFMQADMLYFLTGTGFGVWAPFIYLIAAAGGIISLALGMPPKMYVWFFIGPGIYHWLVDTRSPAHGVQWRVARIEQDQRQVWRLAHVGLVNMNIVARVKNQVPGLSKFSYEGSELQQDLWCRPTIDPVYVSNFFLWFDNLISYTVQRLVDITGVTRTAQGNISTATGGNQGTLPLPANYANPDANRWYLMADKKWVLLDTITSARLNNSDLRDAFATFLSSECGDQLSSAVDHTNFVIAANSQSGQVPCTVMLHRNTAALRSEAGAESCVSDNGGSGPASSSGSAFLEDKYQTVWDSLRKTPVPIPETFRRLFQDKAVGSFVHFLNSGQNSGTGDQLAGFFRTQDVAECHQTFYTLIQGFRWEAAQIYNQLVQSGPIGLEPNLVLYNLFYGWGARKTLGGDLLDPTVALPAVSGGGGAGAAMELEEWTRSLILIHLLRNEFAMAPRLSDKKFTNESSLEAYSSNFIAQTGSKTKYGEVYTWARMIPYIQGVLLYLLAMAYPFACIMIVMPGWHKTLFTWMSFWTWVKMWDAGFAVVTVIERSIWSMLGNSTKLNYLSPLIHQMSEWGQTSFNNQCSATQQFVQSQCFADMKLTASCAAVPNFADTVTGGIPWWHAAAIFDRAFMLGTTIDIDVANGYYIYLMSALYFAVPAATGQIVLGAKAGVAGMVNSLAQGAQNDGGRAASQGFTGDLKNKGQQVSGALGQSATAKAMRKGNFAQRSFDASNAGLDAGLGVASNEATGRGMQLAQQQRGLMGQTQQANSQVTGAMLPVGAAPWFTKLADALPGKLVRGGAAVTPWSQAGTSGSDLARRAGLSDAGGAAPEGGTGAAGTGADSTGGIVGMGARAAPGYLGNAYNATMQMNELLGRLGQSAVMARTSEGINQMSANTNAAQAGLGVSSFQKGSMRDALGAGARTMNQAAEFAGQSGAYYARRDLGDSAAANLSALGVDTGYLAPGNKPAEMTGMAMAGMLGGQSQRAAGYSMYGFGSKQAGAVSSLQAGYGSAQIGSMYNGSTVSASSLAAQSEMALNGIMGQYRGSSSAAGKLRALDWGPKN